MKYLALAALAALPLVAACGPDDEPDTTPTEDTSVDAGDDDTGADVGGDDVETDTTTPGDVEDDTDPDDDAPTGTCDEGVFISRIRGVIADPEGNGLEGKAITCVRNAAGVLNCLRPASAEADGSFVVNVPESSRCMTSLAIRAFEVDADRGPMYCELDIADSGNVMRIAAPLTLYPTTRATTLPDGDDDTERTVVFDDGMELDVIPGDYFGVIDGYADMAAGAVAPSEDLCFLAGMPAMNGLYTFSPEGNITSTGYPMRIPNTDGLAPGTAVTFYVLGGIGTTLSDGTEIHEAEFAEFGAGAVTDDGAFIATADGLGLPAVTWMGWRVTE